MVFCIRLLIVLWCWAKTRKINLMVHYVLCLLRSEAEIGTVRVLCKTRLIFPRINGPIMNKQKSRYSY